MSIDLLRIPKRRAKPRNMPGPIITEGSFHGLKMTRTLSQFGGVTTKFDPQLFQSFYDQRLGATAPPRHLSRRVTLETIQTKHLDQRRLAAFTCRVAF